MTRILLAFAPNNADWLERLAYRLDQQGRSAGLDIQRVDTLAERGIRALRRAAEQVDAVICDFTPTERGVDGVVAPDPDVVTCAALARYDTPNKPVALLLPPGTEPPFDWGTIQPLHAHRNMSAAEFDGVAYRILASLQDELDGHGCFAEPQPKRPPTPAVPAEVFLAMPFQGYIGALPDRRAFDFTRMYEAAQTAVARASERLGAPINLTAVGKTRGAEHIWYSILELIARASAVIVDLSPDMKSGLSPNPNALTEATIARAVYGHEASMFLCQQSHLPHRPGERPRMPAWSMINRHPYDPTASLEPLIAEMTTMLVETLAPKIKRNAPPTPEPTPQAPTQVGETGPGAVETGPRPVTRSVDKMLHVPKGDTLTINPGEVWHFEPGAGLDVQGRLIAKGTLTHPIRLTGDIHDWEGVEVRGPNAHARLHQVIIENAHPRTRQDGGGLVIWQGATAEVSRCTFRGNKASQDGGGLNIRAEHSDAVNLDMRNSLLEKNEAGRNGGGAMLYRATGRLLRCTLRANVAVQDGGGLCALGGKERSTELTAQSCNFAENRAGRAGGGLNVSAFSVASLLDCGVSANRAGEYGGGLISVGSEARPTEVRAERCQFVENQAERNGGGLNVNRTSALRVWSTVASAPIEPAITGAGSFRSAAKRAPPRSRLNDVSLSKTKLTRRAAD